MGIRNLCLTERKIKIGQGFQSGNWGDHVEEKISNWIDYYVQNNIWKNEKVH